MMDKKAILGNSGKRKSRIFTIICVWLVLVGGLGGVISSEQDIVDENKSSRSTLGENQILYVGGNGAGNYTSIQDAIDEVNSVDTIRVEEKTGIKGLSKSQEFDSNHTIF